METYEPCGEWAERAACRGLTDVFFALPSEQAKVRQAKAICHTCPVLSECLEHAVHNPERYGIRAGLGPKGISKERVKRGISQRWNEPFQHGTRSSYTRGCRCDSCRSANTIYQRQKQREKQWKSKFRPNS